MKQSTPAPVWSRASGFYWWWYNRGRHRLAASLSPRWRRSLRDLRGFANSHLGQRCFIIGNGPSLRQTDLMRLQGEVTFGLNRIYLLFDELGFATTYYVAVNTLVIEQSAEEIRRLTMPKFLTWRSRNWTAEDPKVVFLDADYTGEETFTKDLTDRVFEGGTVTYVALQLAYYMGFAEVILVGVDHRYVTTGPANLTVESQAADPNHFHPDYFGKGFRWQLPDLPASERAFRLARQTFEQDGRRVLDATIGGMLTVFPKATYTDLFRRPGT